MQASIGLLTDNVFAKRVLNKLKLDYAEFHTIKEMLGSDVPVLFCDDKIDLRQAINAGKFVITNHEVLMNSTRKPVQKAKSFYYVMKDFVFGERSFFIDEEVYCCNNSVDMADFETQTFLKEQDVIDVGLTYNDADEPIEGACILVGRQMISLPWKISEFRFLKVIEPQPCFIQKNNKHISKIGSNVDFKAFSHLLLVLLRYAYRRQEIWMPQKEEISTGMGEQEIDFVYPSEHYMKKWRKRFVLRTAQCIKCMLIMLAVFVIAMNCLFNLRSLPNIFPLYRSTIQTRYLPDFTEEMLYADAFLQLLVADKEVVLHDTGDDYEHHIWEYYDEGNPEVQYAYEPDIRYFLGRDYYRYFKQFAGEVTIDESIPTKEAVSQLALQEDMMCIGYANDMLRYVFLLNTDDRTENEYASYFWYDYIYRITSEPMYIYLESEIPEKCEKIVVLWDDQNNLYVMSEEYYEEVTSP